MTHKRSPEPPPLSLAPPPTPRHIDASREPLTYFRKFLNDVRDRTETAMSQAHVFTVCRLALEAQAQATRLQAGHEGLRPATANASPL